MKYEEQLDHIGRLVTALEYIIEQMDKLPVDYPDAMIAYNAVRVGIVPRIHAVCPKCSHEMVVQSSVPVGGLDDALECLKVAVEVLEQELEFQAPSYQYPADYSI